jgi:glycosyltransferase involved in cell wall biosynthesis
MLETLLAQTYADFSIFIADNCSTDTTPEIARQFAARDSRIVYVRNATNLGASGNFNRVLAFSRGYQYFKWAAHDDLYRPTFLQRCVEALDNRPDVVLAYSIVDVVDETDDRLLAKHPFYKLGCLEAGVSESGQPLWVLGPLHLAETADPAERYSEFLNRMIALFPLYGLIRVSALPGIVLRPYFGADRSLLGELVLKGPFQQVHERLYVNRFHASAARLLPQSQHAFWSGGKAGLMSANRRQQIDLIRAPFRAGLRTFDCLRCVEVAMHHFVRRALGRLYRSLAGPLLSLTRGHEPHRVS